MVALTVDSEALEKLARALADLRQRGGRLFLLGSASESVSQLRSLAGIEATGPGDWLVDDVTANDAVLLLTSTGERPATGLLETLAEVRARRLLTLAIAAADTEWLPACDELVFVPPLEGGLPFQSVIWHCLLSHPDVMIRPHKRMRKDRSAA